MGTPDIGSLADRHRTQLDALRQNIATAPAGGFSPRVHRKISLYASGSGSGTPRASMSAISRAPSGGVAAWAAHTRTVPAGGYMPSPRRVRSAVAGASFLQQGSPRLTKWTIEDAGPAFRKEEFGKPPASSKMDVDNQLSHAYILVERMLAGETALEDFVSSVETAEGVHRWALWMEISGRLQIAQSASRSVLRRDKKAEFVDEPGWKLRNDRILAQSIMRKPLLASKEVQADAEDIDEATNPFHTLDDDWDSPHSPQPRKIHRNDASSRGRRNNVRSPANDTSLAVAHATPLSAAAATPMSAVRQHRLHSNAHGPPLGDGLSHMNVLSMKVGALSLLHQLVGLEQNQLCNLLLSQMSGILQTDLCRIYIIDEPAKELEPFHLEHHHAEDRISVNDLEGKSIAGETLQRKQHLHVQDVSASSIFNPLVDLGPVASRQGKWEHGNLLSLPVASNSGYLEMIIILGRSSWDFSSVEIEAMSWMAVTLGNVLHHNKHLATSRSQIQLMDGIAEHAVFLARKGCEVQDPRFWMKAFDAQVAQIAIVHRESTDGNPLLYCSCSDTSKEEVSMTCFPLRGMHKKMVLYADGQPWWSSHAEDERGTLDREIDLGSSEWIGRTSMMLIPVMSGAENGSEPGVEKRVIAIIMVASTERTYNAAHRKILMAMTSHIQLAVTNLLGSWEKDATGSYKDSFVKSDGGQRRAEDEKEEVFSRPDSTAAKEWAEFDRESAEAAMRREMMLQAELPKLYEYTKAGLARMLDEESAMNTARIRAEARELNSPLLKPII